MNKEIRIVFDGPPGPEGGRFVEVVSERGESLQIGKWVESGEYWYLEIPDFYAEYNKKDQQIAALTAERDDFQAMLLAGEPPYYTKWREVTAQLNGINEKIAALEAAVKEASRDDYWFKENEKAQQQIAALTAELDSRKFYFNEAIEKIKSMKVEKTRQTEQIATLIAERDNLTKRNKILEVKNKGSLANNLCPDHRDKQAGKQCLACNIEHLTATSTKQAEALKEIADPIKFMRKRLKDGEHLNQYAILLSQDHNFLKSIANDVLKETALTEAGNNSKENYTADAFKEVDESPHNCYTLLTNQSPGLTKLTGSADLKETADGFTS